MQIRNWKYKASRLMRGALRWGRRHLPPGVRTVIGIPLIVGGIFGFLPILGFWMAPLGVALVALDVPPLARRLIRRLARYERDHRRQNNNRANSAKDDLANPGSKWRDS